MKKYFFVLFFLAFSLALTGCGNNQNKGEGSPAADKNAQIIFFYGSECPHCKAVEKYITDNKVSEKVNFVQTEVYHNKDNAAFMMEKQNECGLDKKMVGAVPFLWTKEKCFLGQDEIIQYFKDKTNEK